MICKTYKNGNITVKHEAFFDGDMPSSFTVFPAWLHEHEDGFDVSEIGDFQNWGNDYGCYPLKIYVNGVLGIYPVTPDDYELYLTGKTVRIIRESLAPLFVLPKFYKYTDAEIDGVRGRMFWMCSPITDKQRADMDCNGVMLLTSVCEYAPEIKGDVVFIAHGVPFSYC